MEWTGPQQLLFLLQSAGMGMGLGLLFDGMTGVGRMLRRRFWVFLLDVLFGVLASFITFFSALGIMDGDLHPLLFIGGIFGFLVEHISVGVFISRWLCAGLCAVRRSVGKGLSAAEGFFLKNPVILAKIRSKRCGKPPCKVKKPKKFSFFQKNT